MDGLAAGHLFAIAFWGGIVAVEAIVEGAGLARKIDLRTSGVLHRWIDRYIELPTLIAVTATGLALWARADWDGSLFWKAATGLGAVAFNLLCYGCVEKRYAIAGEVEARRFTWRALYLVAPGFPLAFASLYLGGVRAGWW